MNLSKTAQIALSCGLFLLLVFITSSFDLSAVIGIAFYCLLRKKSFLPLFVAAIILFAVDIILRQLDMSIRFISDLSVDSYILLLTGVWLYLKSRKEFDEMLAKLLIKEKKLLSKSVILAGVISVIIALLIFPLTGSYIALVFGYFLFSYLVKQFNGKIAIGFALFFLVLSAIFVLVNKNVIAEEFANFAYFFLAVGTLQEVVNLVKQKNYKESKEPVEDQKYKKEDKSDILVIKNVIAMKIRAFPKYLLIGAVIIAVSALAYLLYSKSAKPDFSLSLPKISQSASTPIPTPTILVSASPEPEAKFASKAAELKVFIQNGTEITGLAASTAAKLKKAGFKSVKTGDAAKQDYQKWELISKAKDDSLLSLLKNLLELSDLEAKEASVPAGFDVLIITGSQK